MFYFLSQSGEAAQEQPVDVSQRFDYCVMCLEERLAHASVTIPYVGIQS